MLKQIPQIFVCFALFEHNLCYPTTCIRLQPCGFAYALFVRPLGVGMHIIGRKYFVTRTNAVHIPSLCRKYISPPTIRLFVCLTCEYSNTQKWYSFQPYKNGCRNKFMEYKGEPELISVLRTAQFERNYSQHCYFTSAATF